MNTEIEIPSQEWLNDYEKIKDILVPLCNLGELYELDEAFGKRLFILDMGEVYFPTGQILVRDPLMFFNKNKKTLFSKSANRNPSHYISCRSRTLSLYIFSCEIFG